MLGNDQHHGASAQPNLLLVFVAYARQNKYMSTKPLLLRLANETLAIQQDPPTVVLSLWQATEIRFTLKVYPYDRCDDCYLRPT